MNKHNLHCSILTYLLSESFYYDFFLILFTIKFLELVYGLYIVDWLRLFEGRYNELLYKGKVRKDHGIQILAAHNSVSL